MKTVNQLLEGKGENVWSANPQMTVYEALEMMSEKNVGALVVLEGEKMVGIFSERDYARKVILKGKSPMSTLVGDIMSRKVTCVRRDQSIEDCMALMTDKRVRHLPVLQDNRVVGVISIGDVVKDVISEQEFIIEQLENYIAGSR